MRKLLLYIVALIACNSLHAQLFSDYNFKFRTYTSNDGLVHNSVKKCISDSKGFLWVITEDGLSRFDGYQFQNFQHSNSDSNSLPVNNLTDIAIDGRDRVWLAYQFGFCYYDQEKRKFFTALDKGQLVPANVICLAQDRKTVFIATKEKLVKYDPVSNIFYPTCLDKPFPDIITNLYADNANNLWLIVGRLGYHKYNISTDTTKYFDTDDWPTNTFQDKKGGYYLSTWASGLKIFDGNKPADENNTVAIPLEKERQYPYIISAATEAPLLTGEDIIWAVTQTGGIALFSKSQKKFIRQIKYDPNERNGIKTDFFWNIYTAPDGTLWLCSWHGLVKVNKKSQQFQSAELPALNTDFYNCISGMIDDPYDKDIAWMSVMGTGIARYSKSQQKISQWFFRDLVVKDGFDSSYDKRWLIKLFKDSNNVLWSASYGGLAKIKHGNASFLFVKDNGTFPYCVNLCQDKKGNLWLCGEFLAMFDPYTEKFRTWRLPRDGRSDFTAVTDGNNGKMIVSSAYGLYELDLSTNQFSALPLPADWKNIQDLVRIDDKLYLGSNRGFGSLDINSQQFTRIGAEQYIEYVGTACLQKDRAGNCWIYSKNGLFRYEPRTNGLLKFTAADGIYDNAVDVTFLFDYNKDIYIGYRMAYTRFDPLQVTSNDGIPIPYITGVRSGDHYFSSGSLMETPALVSPGYAQNNISFDFTAIEYNNPERLSFSYLLEGFDATWIAAGSARTVTYNNLPGGTYTFKVKVCNSNGLCNEQVTSIRVKITPPFWKTWWFLVLVVLAISFLSVLFGRWLQRNRTAVEKEKLKVEQLRTAQYLSQLELNEMNDQLAKVELASLRSQMNPHFLFNSLNSIHKYIWENKQEHASEYLTKFSRLVRMILENSKEKAITLSRELESLRLYIELEHRRCNNKFEYTITLDEGIDSSNILVPSMIIQPYIENAIWHGLIQKKSPGMLSLRISVQEQSLLCRIDDDGIGRERAEEIKAKKKDKYRSLGMDITRERLELLGKESGSISGVQVIDKKDDEGNACGTTVILQLPLHHIF